MSHHLDLVSHWRLAAPVDRVWAALSEPERWPSWWPCLRSVRLLQPGGFDGLGRVLLFHWGRGMLCDIEVEVETVACVHHQCLRSRTRGRWLCEGIWLLHAEGLHTDVTCVWRMHLDRHWQRWSAPLLRWNHEGVMRAGGAGLARFLAPGV